MHLLLCSVLLYLKEAAVNLQGETQDIVAGVHLIQQCYEELRALRADVSVFSARIFQHSSRVASKSGIAVTMPRVRHHTSEVPGVKEFLNAKLPSLFWIT